MLEEQELLALLEEALKNTLRAPRRISFSPELVLLGEGGALDSLDTMLFLGEVEDLLKKKLGWELEMMSGDAFGRDESPFRSIRGLTDYILSLLKERQGELL